MGMGVAAQAGDTLATVTACSWTPNTRAMATEVQKTLMNGY